MHGDIGYKFCWLLPQSKSTSWTWISWDTNWEQIIISSSLTTHQEISLLKVLKRCKKAIGWQISDHIYMEEEAKPIRQPQRRLNPHLQEVVRAEVLNLLQAGIIYPISDSLGWVLLKWYQRSQGLLCFKMKKEKLRERPIERDYLKW